MMRSSPALAPEGERCGQNQYPAGFDAASILPGFPDGYVLARIGAMRSAAPLWFGTPIMAYEARRRNLPREALRVLREEAWHRFSPECSCEARKEEGLRASR